MFQLFNGGIYSQHDLSYRMERTQGFDRYVLLLIKSEAKLTIAGVQKSAAPNQALLIPPSTPYSYYNPHGKYMDDWIHFSADASDLSLIDPKAFCEPFFVSNLSALTIYIQQALWEQNYAPTHLSAQHVDGLLRFLFEHLMADFHQQPTLTYHPYLYAMQQLRLHMQANPGQATNAKEAARKIGISLSHFQHLYADSFHISYQKDLIQMRIHHAKELIVSTTLTLEKISSLCGYQNEVHFYRQFQSVVGMAPGKYRHLFSYTCESNH